MTAADRGPEACDVLVLAAHPDDAELGCGGTILDLLDRGRRVVVVDMTRGEMGTRGTAASRAAECERATRELGLTERVNLELPDANLRDDGAAERAVVGVLRRFRPRLLLAPHPRDAHPDHEVTAHVARRAFFLAGLVRVHPDLGPPHRPQQLFRYPGNDLVEPTFCVDITRFSERKSEVVACYATQVAPGDRSHFLRGLDVLERVEARDRFYGSLIGVRAAEPFVADGPFRVDAVDGILTQGGAP